MRSSKLRTIAYWTTTAVIALFFIGGGAADVAQPPDVVKLITHLGYPTYFATLIGVWKVLGGIAVIAPRLPRLKEWAYAGIFFDLTGAAVSHVSVGDGAFDVAIPLALSVVLVASWALRPASRRLGVVLPWADAAGETATTPGPAVG